MKLRRHALEMLGAALSVVASAAAGPAAASASNVDVAAQSLSVYSRADHPAYGSTFPSEQHRILRLLASGAYGKPSEFAGEARLSFRDGERTVAESRSFSIKLPAPDAVANDWHSENGMVWWQGSPRQADSPLVMPLTVDYAPEPFRLLDYDEIHVDESSVGAIPTCDVQIELGVHGPAGRMVFSGGTASKALLSIDASTAQWTKKGIGYLASRELGFAPDEVWRYSQDGQYAVLQRRFRNPVDNVDSIEIAVASGVIIRQVNLRVGTSETGRGAKVLQFPDLRVGILSDGGHGVRLKLREALQRQFAQEWNSKSDQFGRPRFYLSEAVVFVPGEARTIAPSEPVQRIELIGAANEPTSSQSSSAIEPIALPSSTSRDGNGASTGKRLVVDLRNIWRRGEIGLETAALALRPPMGASSCAVILQRVQAVSLFKGKIPEFAEAVNAWSQRWGSVLGDDTPHRGFVNAPGLVGDLFFADLTAFDMGLRPEHSPSVASEDETRASSVRHAEFSPVFRILGGDGRPVQTSASTLISSNGAVLTVDGDAPLTTLDRDALVLTGRAPTIEVNWPFQRKIAEGTWFYLAVPQGAEQIGAAFLIFDLTDGRTIERKVVANHLRQLHIDGADVRDIRLRITPAALPYRFSLSEMRLFRPHEVTFAQALSIALPAIRSERPKPVVMGNSSGVLELQPGKIAAIADRKAEFRFSTPLARPLDIVRGLTLKYRLPLAYVDDQRCPVVLDLHWAKSSMRRQLCVERPSGNLFIPVAQLVGVRGNPPDLGALTSIDWLVRVPSNGGIASNDTLELTFSIEGREWTAAADQLQLSPLFRIDGSPVFCPTNCAQKILVGGYAGTFSVPLDSAAVSRLIQSKGDVGIIDHSIVSLDEIVLEPKRPLTGAQWRELNAFPALTKASHWRLFLFFAAAVMLVGLGWWKGQPAIAASWARAAPIARFTLDKVRSFKVEVSAVLAPRVSRLNLAIGVLAVASGIWAAGRLGLTFPGAMLALACGLTSWGVYSRWQELRRGPQDARQHWIALLIGCAIAVWALGRGGTNSVMAWALFPLVAATYAASPELRRRIKATGHGSLYMSLLGWLFVTSVLYVLGSLSPTIGYENYSFTLGALGAVFAGRAGLLILERTVRSHWPILGERVYGGAGTIYLTEAILGLFAIMAMLGAKLELLAQHAATVVYFCLVFGMVKEAWACRKARHRR